MSVYSLIKALRSASTDGHRCLGCEYANNCSIHGCQMMKQAADQLERLNQQLATGGTTAQNQAIFRLGQMDMRASVAAKIRKQAADFLSGCMYRRMLLVTADQIDEMEVI